jgi:hypothetical protein
MTIEELQAELAGAAYAQSAERAAFIAERAEADGYCPFIAGGRQYVAAARLRARGYVIQEIGEGEG